MFERIIPVTWRAWFHLCLSRSVVRRALNTALVVGTILIVINHGDAILRGQLDLERLSKMMLTVCVPYLVSTFSSVSAIQHMQVEKHSTGVHR